MSGNSIRARVTSAILGEQRARALHRKARIVRTYGRLHPRRLRLQGSSNWLWINRDDPRAARLVEGLGRGHQPALRTLWHRAVVRLEPQTVIDVGVNYGEFLLAETYKPGTRLLGVEANRLLRPWLERSRRAHPNIPDMRLVFALASDHRSETTEFFVNHAWSGASRATRPEDDTVPFDRVVVPVLRIDDLVEKDVGRLLFKIDVEGWEPKVVAGMEATLDSCSAAIGFVEFDEKLLLSAGSDPLTFLRALTERFQVHAVSRSGQVTPVDSKRSGDADLLAAMRALSAADSHACTDLLLVSNRELSDKLLAQPSPLSTNRF